ncbi:MAG: RDD family protein [Vibrio sp.]
MSLALKYKRAGAFIIDMSIVQMFALVAKEIYLGVLSLTSQGVGFQFSLNDDLALPMLLLMMIGIMLIVIGVYMGYHALCYKLLGNSLSRYFLSLQVVSVHERELDKKHYLKREFDKIYLTVATLGLYALYAGAQYLTHSNPPWHDKKYQTQVVQS